MHISYVILTHSNPEQFGRLVAKLQAPNVSFFVHVDKKSDIFPFRKQTENYDNVHYVDNRHDVRWGHYSVLVAYIECLKEIVRKAPGSFIIHLSGQDYPLKSNAYISEFIEMNKAGIFMEHFTLPYEYWSGNGGTDRVNLYFFHIRKRQIISIVPGGGFCNHNVRSILKAVRRPSVFPALFRCMFVRRHYPLEGIIHYGGEFWISWPEEAAARVLDFIARNPKVEEYYGLCSNPDEIMLQTLICNADYLNDFTVVNSTLKYIDWSGKRGISPVTLIMEDKDDVDRAIGNPNTLFARKFDSNADSAILDYIDSRTE